MKHLKKWEIFNEENIENELKKYTKDENGYALGIVTVNLSDIINTDLEGFLNILSEKLTGSVLLMDTSYKVISNDGDSLSIEVSGDVSMIEEQHL